MFGLKKKEKIPKEEVVETTIKSNLHVHTMQDDLDAIAAGQTGAPIAPKAKAASAESSPFFTPQSQPKATPTTTPNQVAPAESATKVTTTLAPTGIKDNPFFQTSPDQTMAKTVAESALAKGSKSPDSTEDKSSITSVHAGRGSGSISGKNSDESLSPISRQLHSQSSINGGIRDDATPNLRTEQQVSAKQVKPSVPGNPPLQSFAGISMSQKSTDISKKQDIGTATRLKNEVSEGAPSPFENEKRTAETTLNSLTADRKPSSEIILNQGSSSKNSGESKVSSDPLDQVAPSVLEGPKRKMKEEIEISQKGEKSETDLVASSRKVALMITLIVLSVLLAVGGLFIWYWWSERNVSKAPQPVDQEVMDEVISQEPENISENTADEVKSYAVNFPNYIEISDNETAKDYIESKMVEINTGIKANAIVSPISFLITDTTGNTLTFRDFTKLMDIALTEDVYSSLDDSFELYAVGEGAATRFGFGVDVLDEIDARTAMKLQEETLPGLMTPLYGGEGVTNEDSTFQDNVYGEYPIRFLNLADGDTFSIDYAIGDRLFVGTSRKSHRAILEKYGDAKAVEAEELVTQAEDGTPSTNGSELAQPSETITTPEAPAETPLEDILTGT